MDSSSAISVLSRVLGLLPPGVWWPLRRQRPDDLDVSHAFNLPEAGMDSVLLLSGILREHGKGFGLVRSRFDDFINASDGALVSGNIKNVQYIAN